METTTLLAGTDMGAMCTTLLFVLIGLAMFAFWLWMLIDAIKYTPSENNLRLIWILVIILVGPGALIYFFVQRPRNPKAGCRTWRAARGGVGTSA